MITVMDGFDYTGIKEEIVDKSAHPNYFPLPIFILFSNISLLTEVVMHIIHSVLGSIILFFDWLFTPKGIKRDTETQEKIDGLTSKLSLYQYKACPFCVKVRRAMKRNSLNIQTYDAKRSETSRKELIEGGGRLKVPCLRVECAEGEVNWIYESSDIITYLESGLTTNSFNCKAV